LWRFYVFSIVVLKNIKKTALLTGEFFFLEIGHEGYKKQYFKNANVLSDKMPTPPPPQS
jgi:hypothetical protein